MFPYLKVVLLGSAALVSLQAQQPRVIVGGLDGAMRMALTPRGSFVVSHVNLAPNLGQVSLVSKAGARSALLTGLPSGTEVVGGPSGPTALAVRDRTLYLAIGAGESERPGAQPGTSMWNPAGISSPLFASVLTFVFSKDIDDAQGPYALTPAIGQRLADGHSVRLQDAAGNTAMVSVLADFPDLIPDPNVIWRGSNPWGLAVSTDGNTVYLTDGSTNHLVRIDARTGKWHRLVLFPPFPNPTPIGPPAVDYVPTSVRVFRDRLLVTNLSGFPFLQGRAQVVSVSPEGGMPMVEIGGLTSVTDVAVREVTAGPAQWYVLQFSVDQASTPASPGSLVMYDSPQQRVIAPVLPAATTLVIDGGSAYVLDLIGRISEIPLP